MKLADYIRTKREAHGLNQSKLADLAKVNRNTVTNLESGKDLRFATVVEVMHALGYVNQSPEMRECALLWLEQISSIQFSRASAADVLDELVSRDTIPLEPLLVALCAIIRERGLNPDEVHRLAWAAAREPALEMLRLVREMAAQREQQLVLPISDEPLHSHVAETPAAKPSAQGKGGADYTQKRRRRTG